MATEQSTPLPFRPLQRPYPTSHGIKMPHNWPDLLSAIRAQLDFSDTFYEYNQVMSKIGPSSLYEHASSSKSGLPVPLQTLGYIESLLRTLRPGDANNKHLTEVKVAHGKLILGSGAKQRYIINEAALQGEGEVLVGRTILRDQVEHLLDLVQDNRNVSIQILPRPPKDAAPRPSVELFYPDQTNTNTAHAFTETDFFNNLVQITRPGISSVERAWSMITQSVLSVEESRARLEVAADNLR